MTNEEQKSNPVFNPAEILAQMRKDYWEGLARPPEEEADEIRMVLAFDVEKQLIIVPVEAIREVIKVPPWISKVPRSPSQLLGIINLRGKIIPVLDIRKSSKGKYIDDGKIVIFKHVDQDRGLLVERIIGLPEIVISTVQSPRGMASILPEEAVLGQIEMTDPDTERLRVAILIDAEAFLSSEAFTFQEGY